MARREISGRPSQNGGARDDEKACLFFKTGNRCKTVYYPSLDEAAIDFRALYGQYPTVMSHLGFEPNHRVSGTMCCYGDEVILWYLDDREGNVGWQAPMMDRNGRFYRGAIIQEKGSLPGYGYMRSKEDRNPELIPAGTVVGDYLAYGGDNPVRIYNLLVEQTEMDRIFQKTGKLPTHIMHMDASGSYMYLGEIIWGDEPRIIEEERAAAKAAC